MRQYLMASVLALLASVTIAQADDAAHCAAVRAEHGSISIERRDGTVAEFAQYGQKTCECLLTVAAKHLPEELVTNIKDNHRRGSLLAVGDPALKGTLRGDRYFAAFEALGDSKIRRYDRAMMRECGAIFPSRSQS